MEEDIAAGQALLAAPTTPASGVSLDAVSTDTFGTYQNPTPKMLETPEAPSYRELMEEDIAAQDAARNTILDLAIPKNPDKAARAQELEKRYGIRTEAVDSEFDLIDRKARVEDLKDMARESPLLLQRLTDHTFVNVAHDDVGALAGVERTAKVFAASALSGGSAMLEGVLRVPDLAARVREERLKNES